MAKGKNIGKLIMCPLVLITVFKIKEKKLTIREEARNRKDRESITPCIRQILILSEIILK